MSKHRDPSAAAPTPDDHLMIRALADYYRQQTYLTHTDKDMIGKAFRGGWVARGTEPGMVLITRERLAQLEEAYVLWHQAGGR